MASSMDIEDLRLPQPALPLQEQGLAKDMEQDNDDLPTSSGRAVALDDAFEKAISYALQGMERAEFAMLFPGVSTALLDALHGTYSEMLASVRGVCKSQFKAICSEHEVHQQLQALQQLEATVSGAPFSATPATSGALPLLSPTRQQPASMSTEAPAVVLVSGQNQGQGPAGAAGPGAGGDAALVQRTEEAARVAVLRREAAQLQDMVERARTQEARLQEMLALRQRHADKVAEQIGRVVSDVKQVYDITKVWPGAPRLDNSMSV